MSISKENILAISRDIVASEGLNSLNIRKLAKKCNLAIGSIYNYFPSKDDLLIETIESVWEDIFKIDESKEIYTDFLSYLDHIFNHLISGIKKYPNFFTIHSLSFKAKNIAKAKSSMDIYLEKLSENMIEVLNKDTKVKENVFNDNFRKDDFVRFIISTSVCFIVEKNYDKDILLKIVKKVLY